MRSSFLIFVLAFSVSSCANDWHISPPPVRADVERFHNKFRIIPGKSFLIEPNELQRNSFLFQEVESHMSERILQFGFTRVPDNPDYIFKVSYSVDNGRVMHSGGGNGSNVYSRVVYKRSLKMRVFENANRPEESKLVFEGRVISSGSSKTFSKVRKCLIDALFQNFPGESGRSQKVTLDGDCMS